MSREEIGGRIFIGGLDLSCDEDALEKSFGIFGDIEQVIVMRDRETNRSRGFAFLSFKDHTVVDEAIRRMHGVEIQGRCVTVRKAEKQAAFGDRPRRGGFRGGGRGDSRNYSGRYDSDRGRPSRNNFDDYRPGGRDSGHESRRSSYGDSRGGYRTDERDSRSGYSTSGYGDTRMGSDSRSSSYDYRRIESASDNYRYADRREDSSSQRYVSDVASRDSYNGRYETSHGRSRSPITRVAYREESPVRSRRADTRRDYSPPVVQHKDQSVREYSPGLSRRVYSRDVGYQDRREYVETSYSPPRRTRDLSPDDYSGRYTGGSSNELGSPPRGRSSYTTSSRSVPQSKSPARRNDYMTRRTQDTGRSRDVHAESSGKEYHHSGRSYDAERGSGGSRTTVGIMDSAGAKYSSRYREPSPTAMADTGRSSTRRNIQRSHSPDQRARRY